MSDLITSTQNPLVKQIRRLRRSKNARDKEGLFLVEGIQGVVEAIRSGAPVTTVVLAPELLSSEIAYEAIAEGKEKGIRVVSLSAELFEAISDRDNPVGIATLVKRQVWTLDALSFSPEGLFVALVAPGDPGNVGTVLRTLDAVGADALLLVGPSVDPFHPTAVKASTGALFSIPIVPVPDLDTLLQWSEARGVHVVATSDQATLDYWSFSFPSPLLLVMGSEAHGLSHPERFPLVVRIPMYGRADSLNLGVATALFLYEIRRQQWAAIDRTP